MAKEIEAKCKNCACWVPQEMPGPVEIGAKKRGMCWALPPQPFPNVDPRSGKVMGQIHLRPLPMEDEQCGMFSPHPQLTPGIN